MVKFQFAVVGLALFLGVSARSNKEENIRKDFDRTHSLFAPYIDSNLEMTDWIYGGNTGVSTYKYVRLTPNSPSKTGWVFSKEKLTARDWQIEFQFRVGASERELDGDMEENASNSYRKVFGDGFAFWLTESQFTPGNAFGNSEKFKGLGVFFDTFRNSGNTRGSFPLVSVLVNGDGSKSYDHDNDGGQDLSSCSVKFRNEKIARARVTLLDGSLTVETTIGSGDDWKPCVKIDNVNLGSDGKYVGFTAATGQVYDEHDLVYVMTNKIEKPGSSSSSYKSQSQQGSSSSSSSTGSKSSGGSGWLWFLVFLVCIIGFAAYYYNRAISGDPLTFNSISNSLSKSNKNF